ncbi:MAG: deoxyguanosinetriphosphate triphosphohydrolase [Acidiferrobacterales bacterium]
MNLGITLAPYAASDESSRGRQYREPPPSYRSEFQRDRDRIVHCAAFRRLEYKTQVFVNHEGDLFRTRLTHSMEVAQIGRSVARAMNLNEDLTEAITLAHDLGHTPFGHSGQDALNACMREFGGFEHNLQSLRVVDLLEEKYAGFPGLNLTFETREGILKHCSLRNAAELGELGQRFIEKKQPSLEAQIANVADEIAYNNHDVDDGLRSGLITMEQLRDIELFGEQHAQVCSSHPGLAERVQVHEIVRRMINRLVVDLIDNSTLLLEEASVTSIDGVRNAARPLIANSDAVRRQSQDLKQFLRDQLYAHFRVRRMTLKAHKVIESLFDAFMGDPRLLPPQYQKKASGDQGAEDRSVRARIVADYIAGMTDRYAIQEHQRLFDPGALT